MLNRAAVEGELEQPVARGVSAAELAARTRTHHHTSSISAGGLQRWLVKQNLAVVVDGRLKPTELGLQLGAFLR